MVVARISEILGALILIAILNASLVMVAHAEEKATILSAWSFVTQGSSIYVEVTFSVLLNSKGKTDLLGSVKYTAWVKDPPWIVKVYAALMQYYDYGAGGFITGGAIGSALAMCEGSCPLPIPCVFTRAYYIDYERTIYAKITPGVDYWVWEGEWRLRINRDICACPDSTAYDGYPYLYAIHSACWGGIC